MATCPRLFVLILLAGFPVVAAADTSGVWVMVNPTGRTYSNELVRLKIEVPAAFDPAKWRVTEDGREVPFQAEQVGASTPLWVATDLTNGQKRTFALENKTPAPCAPRVVVGREGDAFVMDNGLAAVRVPARAQAGMAPPPPLLAVRLPDGNWVGQGFWNTDRKLKSFAASVTGQGTLFAKVRLDYAFDGVAGIDSVPAFYRAEVMLPPDRRHAVIEESFEMPRGSYWEFDAAAGWTPRQALTIPHFGGFGREEINDPDGKPYPFPPESLRHGQTRMGDTLLNLIPRWSQAYDDGWFFMAHDGRNAVGALPCRAGKWLWPYDGMIEIKVKKSADYAGFRCPTWRGKRYWFLLAGPTNEWAARAACEEYAVRHSIETLDKIHQEYVLDWPGLVAPAGKDGKPVATPEEYSSGAGRFGRRSKPFMGWGPGAGSISGSENPITALIRAQVYLDPDTFGNYWLFFSPENPNFATSWWGPIFTEAAKCKGHPMFAGLAKMVEMKFREDMYHSVTVPGGAGQECPGYMSVGAWSSRTKFCRENFGFDASLWPQFRAAGSFAIHASQPMPDGSRRSHPGGDTHPPGPNVQEVPKWFGVTNDPATFVTKELPGFGVMFRNRPATPRETYLAFKSGPNRGHFHGDQLSFHYCAYGRPVAVDHHCSYAPRAGQEHMHNRVAFHTDKLPWANMDGYERLIAFATSQAADVAVGQVESERLRVTEEFPPEKWDTSLPEQVFDTPLKYRRTIVMLKSSPDTRHATADIFVIRDQYEGPAVRATYCLHVLGGRCDERGDTFDFEGMQLRVLKPAEFAVSRHDWQHENGGIEATKGLRLTTGGRSGEFVTVIFPRPVRRTDVLTLLIRDVLREAAAAPRDAGGPSAPVTAGVDLSVRLAMREGRLADPTVHATGAGAIRSMYSFTGTAEQAGGTLRLAMDGVRGRGEKERVRLELSVPYEAGSASASGSYTGLVWDVPAMKLKAKGSESPGAGRGGAVSWTVERETYPPTPFYDESWSPPPVERLDAGVRIGGTEVTFGGGIGDDDSVTYVSVKGPDGSVLRVTGREIDMDRSQGEIGLFVPDAGYPFGVIPDWLIRQRCRKPAWYEETWPLTRFTNP